MKPSKLTQTILTIIGLQCATLAPKNAEAGLLIGSLAGAPGKGAWIGASVGTAYAIVAYIFGSQDCETCPGPLYYIPLATLMTGGIGAVLDVETSPDGSNIEGFLAQALPEIDDRETIENLANKIREKAVAEFKLSPQSKEVRVSLTQSEIDEALEAVALTELELQKAYLLLK